MNKKNKNFINKFIWPIISIGGMIVSFYLSSKISFIPNLELCNSNLESLCDIPYLGKLLGMFTTGVLAAIIIWVLIIFIFLVILNRFGFKFKDIDSSF